MEDLWKRMSSLLLLLLPYLFFFCVRVADLYLSVRCSSATHSLLHSLRGYIIIVSKQEFSAAEFCSGAACFCAFWEPFQQEGGR
jgi:hypothetical protein